MGRGIAIGIIAIILIVIVIFLVVNVGNNNVKKEGAGEKKEQLIVKEKETANEIGEDKVSGEATSPETHTIAITSSGFSPSEIEIKQEDRIIFLNQDNKQHWPASDVHPAHRVYPGSDITKCQTPLSSKIFDACHGLNLGERFEFVFTEKGSWNYHDHLRASLTGTINVK